MKKLLTGVCLICLIGMAGRANATTTEGGSAGAQETNLSPATRALCEKYIALRQMDKKDLSPSEKRSVRKESAALRQEIRESGSPLVIYISTTAGIIIIVLLLLILL